MRHLSRAYAVAGFVKGTPAESEDMTFKEVVEAFAATIVSLGGAGAIVLRLSGYLGRIWASRELEKQKQEFALVLEKQKQEFEQLNLELTHQLDLISRRTQIELDALGQLHKLRTETEFENVRELWKHIVRVRNAFRALPRQRGPVSIGPSDPNFHKVCCIQTSCDFVACCKEAIQFLNEEMLSIPKHVADGAIFVLGCARDEAVTANLHPDPYTSEWMGRLERDGPGAIKFVVREPSQQSKGILYRRGTPRA